MLDVYCKPIVITWVPRSSLIRYHPKHTASLTDFLMWEIEKLCG